jgi:malic enzyme
MLSIFRMLKGKIEIHNKVSVENAFDEEKGTLGLIYTPGVAYVATEISNNKELVYDYTSKWSILICVISILEDMCIMCVLLFAWRKGR